MQRVLRALSEAEEVERIALRGQPRRNGSPARRNAGRSHKRRLPRPHAAQQSRAEILKRLQVENRLSAGERYEVERQVRNNEVHSWLTKHSMRVVPRTELSRKRKALLQGCFQLLDVDGSGTIEFEELDLAMKALGFSDADTKEAFERGDASRDGKLDFEEFVQMFSTAWAHREARTAFNDGFGRDMQDVVEASGILKRRQQQQKSEQQQQDQESEDVTQDGSGNGGAANRASDQGPRRSFERPTIEVNGSADAVSPGTAAEDVAGDLSVGEGEDGRAEEQSGEEEEHVTTAFPFALVANSHRITKLIDACSPVVRELSLPKVEVYISQAERQQMEQRAAGRTTSTLLPSIERRGRFSKRQVSVESLPEAAVYNPSEDKDALGFTSMVRSDPPPEDLHPRPPARPRQGSRRPSLSKLPTISRM